ncbi:VOC family protein [Streptomyces cylindrosporus]|uniref:VOC family protein n=1 Tax=Streptomyces cylindrosporus TaxID=2927583 RepID=A0ABS9YAT0_9ACTN|nr:VOC family protein [Streptomyces cylindrosporus]MCI3274326.1 VOC family protein [Streptomyces cylindrosporus]
MKSSDQFHVGLVVVDIAAAAAELSAVFGYQWCEELGAPARVTLPGGDAVLDLRSTYSMSVPRLELVKRVPGTLWEPAAGSGVHHLGYWSDDVAADSAELARRGHEVEALGKRPDGTPYWAFHRSGTGPRIELVARALQPLLEQYWATGKRPS